MVKRRLDRVYDGETDGYVSSINLAEFRYVAARKASVEQAAAHINSLQSMGVTRYNTDDLLEYVSNLKVTYNPSLGDAYAVAAARALDGDGRNVTLLVGADDDYDVSANDEKFSHLIERFRDKPA